MHNGAAKKSRATPVEIHCSTDKNAGSTKRHVLHGTACGFSCKSFSKANVNYSALRSAMKDKRMDTSSVKTFTGCVEVMERMWEQSHLVVRGQWDAAAVV